jgi:hypothetical protein
MDQHWVIILSSTGWTSFAHGFLFFLSVAYAKFVALRETIRAVTLRLSSLTIARANRRAILFHGVFIASSPDASHQDVWQTLLASEAADGRLLL